MMKAFAARLWCRTKSPTSWMWKICCRTQWKKNSPARGFALELPDSSVLHVFSGRALFRRAGAASTGSVELPGDDGGPARFEGGARADQSSRPDYYRH